MTEWMKRNPWWSALLFIFIGAMFLFYPVHAFWSAILRGLRGGRRFNPGKGADQIADNANNGFAPPQS